MITPADAAAAIVYLSGLGCLTVKDSQGTIWADYLNSEFPLLHRQDLQDATRAAVSIWAELRRSYQIDAAHVADAIHRIYRRRLQAAGDFYPDGLQNTPLLELEWLSTVRNLIAAGMTKSEAEAQGWKAVGRKPLPPAKRMTRSQYAELTAHTH